LHYFKIIFIQQLLRHTTYDILKQFKTYLIISYKTLYSKILIHEKLFLDKILYKFLDKGIMFSPLIAFGFGYAKF